MAPSALSRAIRPTCSPVSLPSLAHTALHSLLGSLSAGRADPTLALRTAVENGESAICDARGVPMTAAALAPAVALAMRNNAHIVPCAVFGGRGGHGLFSLAGAAAAWGFAGKRPGGVVVVCARPVRVPFTTEPTPALVMEFAEAARAAAAKAQSEHSDAFYGAHG